MYFNESKSKLNDILKLLLIFFLILVKTQGTKFLKNDRI